MTVNENKDDVVKNQDIKTPDPKPAFVLAAEHAARVEAEQEADAVREKAGFALGTDPEDKKDSGATVTGEQSTTTPDANPLVDPVHGLPVATVEDLSVDLRGKGWIRCADGTRIRDDGRSIHIPGRKFTPAQMAMVTELAAQKGWTTLYAYNPGGRTLNPEVTQKLCAAIAQKGYGMQCCTDQKKAGSLHSHLRESEECLRQTLLCARRAAAAPAPA